jgi:hypothetical protein
MYQTTKPVLLAFSRGRLQAHQTRTLATQPCSSVAVDGTPERPTVDSQYIVGIEMVTDWVTFEHIRHVLGIHFELLGAQHRALGYAV